jgi:hypothetical protein
MPDLDQVKQEEQGRAGQARAISRRMPELEDASKARAAALIAESGLPWFYNQKESGCCRFAAGAAKRNNRFNC